MACPGRFDQPCPIPETCPYHLIFETSPPPGSEALRTHEEVPRPFVIAPITQDGGWLEQGRRQIAPGSELSFDLTLIGRAQDFFPYFVVAFREIDRLGRRPFSHHPRPYSSVGEGRVRVPDTLQRPRPAIKDVIPSEPSGSEATRDQRGAISFSPASPSRTVELRRIDLLDPFSDTAWPVYDSAENLVRPMRKQLTLADCAATAPPPSGRLTLHFLTQTRLKHEGGFARVPEFQIVFRRLLGRLSSLSRFHCGAPLDVDFRDLIKQAGSINLIEDDTRWTRWQRYSSRQGQRMEWEGIVGRAVYDVGKVPGQAPSAGGVSGQAFTPLWKFLKFGEFVHVGHGATFGLGKYRMAGA